MNSRGREARDSTNSSVARYTYMSSGQPSLSPSYTFDPPTPGNVSNTGSPADQPFLPGLESRGFVSGSERLSAGSSAGVDPSVCRSGQTAVCDRGQAIEPRDQTSGTFFDGKDSAHNMSFYTNRLGSMHGLASLNDVGNFYGSHFSHQGDNFSKEGDTDKPSLLPPQLGTDSNIPSSSLYSGIPENYSGRRSNDNGGFSHRHLTGERPGSSFSRSMPAYIPLSNESNYVYINPSSLSSFSPTDFAFPANMQSSFSSLMGHSTSYGRINSAPPSHERFLAATTTSSHRFSGEEEDSRRSAVVDSLSRLRYDSMFPHSQVGVPPDWNHGNMTSTDREAGLLEAGLQATRPSSPKADADLTSVGNQPHSFGWDGSLPRESRTPPTQHDDKQAAGRDDPASCTSRQTYSSHLLSQGEGNAMNTQYRSSSSHGATGRSSPLLVASHTGQLSADHRSFPESSPQLHNVSPDLPPKYAASTNPFYLHANSSQQVPVTSSATNSHAHPSKSSSSAFVVTPSIYSDTSDSEQDAERQKPPKMKKGPYKGKAGARMQDIADNLARSKHLMKPGPGCVLPGRDGKDEINDHIANFDRTHVFHAALNPGHGERCVVEEDGMAVKAEPQQSDGSSSECETHSPTQTSYRNSYQQTDSTLSQRRFTTTLAEDFDKQEGEENPRIRLIIKKEKSVPTLKKPRQQKSKGNMSVTKKISGFGSKMDNRTCPICQKVFSRADSLTCHMRVHTGDRPYQCELCDANYKIAGHLRDHVRSKHSNSRPYLCAKCGKSFAYPTARRRHEKVCGMDLSQRIEFHCTTCEKGFVTAKGFMKHQKTCSAVNEGDGTEDVQELPFTCVTCGQSFATFPGLDRHQRFVCGRTPQKGIYTCEECGKTFQKRHRYIDHTRRHTGDKPYKCSRCDMCFFDKGTLQKHIDRHEGNKRYKCSLCDAAFYSKQCLTQHSMRNHCGVKPFKCNECEEEFSSRPLLSRHIRNIHRQEKLIECKLCGKGFFNSGTWKKHMQWHARPFRSPPVRQHTCNVCGKSFLWKDLRTHITVQHPGISLSKALGKELLKCDVCSKELSCQLSLSLHKLRHSGLKRFKCDYCEMQFYFKHALDRHKRKHADHRPYSCQECGKGFRWSASLSQHMTSHHKPKDFQPLACQDCGSTFRSASLLKQHQMNDHPAKSENVEDIKFFTCNECGEQFQQQSLLNDHLKCHGKVHQYICYHCGVGFVDMSLYESHMSTHGSDDTKPFVCHTCGAGFRQQDVLNRHINHAHCQQQGEVWLCEECGKSFTCRDDLLKHVPRHSNYKGAKIADTGVPERAAVSMQDYTSNPSFGEETGNNSRQSTEWNNELHPGSGDKPFANPSTTHKSTSMQTSTDMAQQTPPDDVLPDFSMFGGQTYRQRFTTFIHQTLPWPRLEEQ